MKQTIGAKVPVRTKAEPHAAAEQHLQFVQANPQRVRAYFEDPVVRYAA